jgi:hypothetical protein
VSRAAQVSFAFFADCRDEVDSALGLNASGIQRSRQSDEAYDAARVIADSRRVEPRSVTPHAHIRAFWKNRVEVCRDNHARLRREPGALCDNIAFFVRSDAQETDFFEAPGDFPSASFFLERRRGYLAYADQFFVKLAQHFIYEAKCLLNPLSAEQACDREAFVCARRVVLHL